MHRQVGVPALQGGFQFVDEQSLATHLAQGRVKPAVASGGQADQRHL